MTGKFKGLGLFVIILVVFLSGINKCESGEVVDRIVAVVNDEIITLNDLNKNLAPYVKKIKDGGRSLEEERKLLFKVRGDILDQLISKTLTNQEVKRFGIEITDEEVDKAIEGIKERNHVTDEQLRAALKKDGMTLEDYRESMKEQMLRSRLINFQVESKTIVTEEEIKAYYEEHREEFVQSGGKKYKLRNILIKVSPYANTEEKSKVKKKAEEVLTMLKSGESFQQVAMDYSESPLAATGGDLGQIGIDVLSTQIQDEIGKLKEGEFTPIIDTDHGYQIFYVESILDSPDKEYEIAKKVIEEKLYKEIGEKRYRVWIDELRKNAQIKIIK
ncbi:MAG: hypothetical protein HN379_04145 [Desulfobacteraceae bacterium]|nr:hypothetical protein [Desulfobacteraceae bacterium]